MRRGGSCPVRFTSTHDDPPASGLPRRAGSGFTEEMHSSRLAAAAGAGTRQDGHIHHTHACVRCSVYGDAQADMPSAEASGAICVQRFDDSRNSAIHTTYRISLRSSSLREPRYPLLRVVIRCASVTVGATGSSVVKDRRGLLGGGNPRRRRPPSGGGGSRGASETLRGHRDTPRARSCRRRRVAHLTVARPPRFR